MTEQTVALVGRDDALALVHAHLEQAGAGAGGVVLVCGEAGIGKTRLCAEVGDVHRRRGGRVLLGRAAPEESTIPFGPLADTLRGARRADPALWTAVGQRADLLSAMLPELGPGGTADLPVLFEALLDAVEESTPGERPTLWVLDDLHWADEATWQFIRYAARRVTDMSLLLVITYRDEEIDPASPRWTGLVRLKREAHVCTCPLTRLGPADAARLTETHAPTADPAVRARIVERSAGTPLLIEELARLSAGNGDLPEIPDVVRATARARAAALRPEEHELLEVAAVAGLAVSSRVLRAVRPSMAVDGLVAVGLLERDREDFRFRHPLLQEAVAAEVPAGRRRALHEELAAAVAVNGPEAAERVAAHLTRAERPDAALAVLERSALAADDRGDVGRCATLYLAALRLAVEQPGLTAHRAELERHAITHLYRARRWTELDPLVRDTWSRRNRVPACERVEIALPLAWQLFARGRIAESWEIIEQELQYAENAGEPAADLHGQAAYVAWLRGDAQAGLRHVDRALAHADPHSAWWSHHFRIHLDYRLVGDRQAAIAAWRANVADAEAKRITDGEVLARWDLAGHTASRADVAAGMAVAERAGATSTLHDLGVLDGCLQLLAGFPDESEALLVRFGSRTRVGEPVAAPWIDVNLALLHLHRGNLPAARAALYGPSAATEAATTEYHQADRALALGRMAWEEERWDDAADHLRVSTRLWSTGCWHTLAGGPLFLPLQVDALLRRGAADAAEEALRAAPTPNGGRFYPAAHAAARFRLHPDQRCADTALAASATATWPWLSALVLAWRAELIGDRDAAATAVSLFADIGAGSGPVRTGRVLRRLGAQTPAKLGPLSEREVEVARLIADGLSNPAIAARLYLSRPTVASHVSHILTKLGFSARSQVAAWVAAGGPASAS